MASLPHILDGGEKPLASMLLALIKFHATKAFGDQRQATSNVGKQGKLSSPGLCLAWAIYTQILLSMYLATWDSPLH